MISEFDINSNPLLQWPWLLLIIIYFIFQKKYKLNYRDLIFIMAVIFFNLLSSVNLFINDYKFTYETPKATLLFLIVVFVTKIKNPDRLLKWIFILIIISVIVEYLLEYVFKLQSIYHFTRYGFIRPYGITANVHLTSLFICSYIFLKGKKNTSLLFSIILLTLQTILSIGIAKIWANKYRGLAIIIGIPILIGVAYKFGHLYTYDKGSMLHIYINSFNLYELNNCYVFGCATREVWLNISEEYNYLSDNGFIRLFSTFGIFWPILFFSYTWRISKIVTINSVLC